MKKKIIVAAIVLVLVFVIANRVSKKQPIADSVVPKQPQAVLIQSVADSQSTTQTLQFPATIVGEDEATITAKASGTIVGANFNVGDFVKSGTELVKIDDTGSALSSGVNDFQSAAVQQSRLFEAQAKNALQLAQKNYDSLKRAFDHQTTPTITKAQVDAAKEQVDIARNQYESAKIGFVSSLDNHLITAAISGYVINKSVSVGDSVSVGQPIATISKTMNVKVQFFVDQEELAHFKIGTPVMITEDGNSLPATVALISPVADQATKRFMIEARPSGKNVLHIGTVTKVTFTVTKNISQLGDVILPLSAITVGQNENYIFLDANGEAKKVVVKLMGVEGETAEISGDIPRDAQIIVGGSKLVKDGDAVVAVEK